MAQTYSIEQAQNHLADIVSEVEQGQTVEITRSGKRIAVVISDDQYNQLTQSNQPDFWQELQKFRQNFDLEELDIGSDVFEGIRDRSPGREVDL
jgi:prevent-host-death family protein